MLMICNHVNYHWFDDISCNWNLVLQNYFHSWILPKNIWITYYRLGCIYYYLDYICDYLECIYYYFDSIYNYLECICYFITVFMITLGVSAITLSVSWSFVCSTLSSWSFLAVFLCFIISAVTCCFTLFSNKWRRCCKSWKIVNTTSKIWVNKLFKLKKKYSLNFLKVNCRGEFENK